MRKNPSGPTTMRSPSLLKKAMFLLAPWVVLLGSAELATRFLVDQPRAARQLFDLSMSEPDQDRVWRYKPNFRQAYQTKEFSFNIRTGSWRLRDSDPLGTADVRILAIGNSFTFGWGVEEPERMTERLERTIAEALRGRSVRVLNAGHWSYTFDQHLLVAKELVPRFRPHLIIHGLYAPHVLSLREHVWKTDQQGNIVKVRFEKYGDRTEVMEDGALKRTNPLIESPPMGSRFLAKVFQQYFRWKQRRTAASWLVALQDPDDRSLDVAWERAGEVIQQTARYLENENVEYLTFEIPQDLQVSTTEWPDWAIREGRGRTLDPALPTRRFGHILGDLRATWIPLRGTFRDSYDPALYFPIDPHWTAKGHDLAARVLAPHVLAILANQ